MTRQRQFQSAAEGGAVNGRHNRFATGFQRPHIGFQAVDHGLEVFGLLAGDFVKLVQVAAGEEGFLGGGNNDAFDLVQVTFDLVDGVGQGGTKLAVHGVGGLARHVDGQGQNLV